jgi:hypothetical protein
LNQVRSNLRVGRKADTLRFGVGGEGGFKHFIYVYVILILTYNRRPQRPHFFTFSKSIVGSKNLLPNYQTINLGRKVDRNA